MSLQILNAYDVTDDATVNSRDSATLSDVYNLLVREREYRLSDPSAKYNPFANGGIFNTNTWRNGEVVETDQFSNVISVSSINDVNFSYTEQAKETLMRVRDSFGVLKDWIVEELLLKSENTIAAQYTTAAAYVVSYSALIALNNAGTPLDIQVGDIVSFNPDIVPRYQVVGVTAGSPSPSIQLDRGLEFDVPSGAVLRVMSPVVKTGAQALKDALIASGVVNIGSTFDVLDTNDTAAGLNLRLFVRRENNIKLTDHLNKIMEMADLFLTVDANGQINTFRGLQYDGRQIVDEITGSEIVLPAEIKYDTTKLFYAYDCLYTTAGKVAIASNTVANDLLLKYAAKARWQPVSASDSSPLNYQYLYADATSADFFGARRITYNGYPRAQMTCALKQAYSGQPNRKYNLTLGKKLLVSLDLGGGRALTREPATVIGYTYDNDQQFYPQVVLELTNWLYPALPVA